ncbi:MAG TPA: hypothetical protein VM264_11350, partial [Acidimicrobiales bacterium]|nr:hypothetical protein [Acidimicrobiales bacterium]
PIVSVELSREVILVRVQGVSKVAELIAAEVVEAMWRSAGASKKWSEIEPHIQLVGYATGTVINLGRKFEDLLHPSISGFSSQITSETGGLAFSMGPQKGPAYQRAGTPSIASVGVATLERLSLLFQRFDLQTGQHFETNLTFSVRARGEKGTGIVYVTSELPFEKHVQLLQDLRNSIT